MSPRLECLFALAFLTAGCDGGLRPFEAPDRVVALVIEPDSILLDRGEEWQFTAVGRTGRGTTRSVMPTWSAAGGAISPSGVFTADTVDGHAVINAVYVGEADTLHARAAVLVRRRRPGYYASPAGSSSADGSWRRPWDLATALAGGGGAIGAGDTLWLWGGTYQGAYRSTLEGASGRPVVVRPFPTERAVIDGARSDRETLIIDGAWTLYWGLELTNSITARTSRRPQAVWIRDASDVKLIDLIVHDVGMGVYTNSSARNIEIYGSLFYNNGWQSSSRSDGHGIYLKNDGPGTKVVRDNVLFNHYGLGIHAYTNAGSGQLRNLVIEGNVVFNSGSLSTYTSSNVLVGGDEPVVGAVVRDNLTYFSPGVGASNLRVGYSGEPNASIVVTGNYVVGGRRVFEAGYWANATITDNTIAGPDTVVRVHQDSLTGYVWGGNRYYRDPQAAAWSYGGGLYDLGGFQVMTGLATSDQAVGAGPSQPTVFVRPHRYEAGRGWVIVYNWNQTASANADLSAVLAPGDRYEIRNVQAVFGAPVQSGTFDGAPIALPMNGVTPPTPVGGSRVAPRRTGPRFDVFLVTRVPPP